MSFLIKDRGARLAQLLGANLATEASGLGQRRVNRVGPTHSSCDDIRTMTHALRPDVNEQIECAHTLASRFYTDPQSSKSKRTKSSAEPGNWSARSITLVVKSTASSARSPTPKRISPPSSPVNRFSTVRDKQGTLRAFSNCAVNRGGPSLSVSAYKNADALPISRLDLHARWPIHRNSRCRKASNSSIAAPMGMVPVRLETWEGFRLRRFLLPSRTIIRVSRTTFPRRHRLPVRRPPAWSNAVTM